MCAEISGMLDFFITSIYLKTYFLILFLKKFITDIVIYNPEFKFLYSEDYYAALGTYYSFITVNEIQKFNIISSLKFIFTTSLDRAKVYRDAEELPSDNSVLSFLVSSTGQKYSKLSLCV